MSTIKAQSGKQYLNKNKFIHMHCEYFGEKVACQNQNNKLNSKCIAKYMNCLVCMWKGLCKGFIYDKYPNICVET